MFMHARMLARHGRMATKTSSHEGRGPHLSSLVPLGTLMVLAVRRRCAMVKYTRSTMASVRLSHGL